MKVVLTAAAETDMAEIGDWIARDSPTLAVWFVNQLNEACDGLCDYPKRFQLVANHEETGIRRRPHGDYLIFYWIKDEQTVEILHVLHGARDYERIVFGAE